MQYKIVCSSPLLQYTLEYFLKGHLNEKGIVITDNPEIDGILIGKDIKKPFDLNDFEGASEFLVLTGNKDVDRASIVALNNLQKLLKQ